MGDIAVNDKVNELLVQDHLIVFDSPAEEKSSDTDEEEPFQVIETNTGLKVVSPKREFGNAPFSPTNLKNEKDWSDVQPHLSPNRSNRASPASSNKASPVVSNKVSPITSPSILNKGVEFNEEPCVSPDMLNKTSPTLLVSPINMQKKNDDSTDNIHEPQSVLSPVISATIVNKEEELKENTQVSPDKSNTASPILIN